jgi:hypothetical protein
MSRKLLFSEEKCRPDVAKGVELFERTSWIHRLILLHIWRSLWDLEIASTAEAQPGNPIIFSRTVEFQLAYKGAFGKLRREGGHTAAANLCALGYLDFKRKKFRTPFRCWLAAAAAFLLLGFAVWFAGHTLRAWNDANEEWSNVVTESLQE